MPETTTHTPLTAEQFPIFLSTLGAKGGNFVRPGPDLPQKLRLKFETELLPLINDSIAAGEIANPRFIELKEWVNNRLDEGYGIQVKEPYFYAGKWESLPPDIKRVFDDISILYAHTLAGVIARLEKAERRFGPHAVLTTTLAYLREVKPLTDAVLTLKGMAKKIVRKPAEDAERPYAAPQVSHRDTLRVQALLREITQRVYEEQVAGLTRYFTTALEGFLEKQGSYEPGYAGFSKFFAMSGALILAQRALEQTTPRDRKSPYRKTEDFDALVKKEAEDQARMIQERFVYKNTKKLDSILVAKNNLKLAQIGEIGIEQGMITGWLHLMFEDGSRFSVKNMVVWSYSIHNRVFCRFPTTFHNVVFPNSRTIKKASEKQMNEEFAKEAAAA